MAPENTNEPNETKVRPNLRDKDYIFKLASDVKCFVDFQNALQLLDFDVNMECDKEGNFLVHVAVQKGLSHLPLLMALVKTYGADIELGNTDGMTPLMLAASAGNHVLCDFLICLFEANVNKPNSQTGRTPLHYAADQNHRNTVECLIQRGANVNLEDHDGLRAGDSPTVNIDCREIIEFNRVRRLEVMSDSVKRGEVCDQLHATDLYVVDCDGNTLIMLAAKHNQFRNLQLLLEISKSTIDAQNTKTGMTALAMAARMGSLEATLILLRHKSCLTIADMEGNLPLHYAVMNNHENIVSAILEHDPNTYQGLHQAIHLCKRASILVKLKLAHEKRQEKIVLPKLMECSINGHAHELFPVLDEGDMIYHQKSGSGIWPLFLAVENGHLEVLKLIYEFGGDLSQKYPATGGTALHMSAKMGHHHIVSFLMQFCKDSQKDCPLRDSGGACRSCQCYNKQNSLLDINAVDSWNKTALHLAAENGFSEIVLLLISHGASTSLLDSNGELLNCPKFEGVQTALETHRLRHTQQVMRCIEDKSGKSFSLLQKIWLPKFDHHLRSKDGDTPLMVAASAGNMFVIRFLLESAVYVQQTSAGYESGSGGEGDSDTDSGVLDLTTGSPPDGTIIDDECEFSLDGIAGTFSAEFSHDGRQDFTCSDLQRHSTGLADSSKVYQRKLMLTVPEASRPYSQSIYQNGLTNHIHAMNLKNGRNILHCCILQADRPHILSLFLEQDPSVLNMQDASGETVLHMACRMGRRKSVEMLLARSDVDFSIRTVDGHLPEDLTHSSAIRKLVKRQKLS